nr:uncharacterized protein LOC100207554 isoform X2 [Hydra vulgaris]
MTNLLDFSSNPELFALEALEYIKHKKIEQFLTTVQHLNDCYDKEFAKLQKFAEYCIKDILILLQTSLNNASFEYLLWSSLNLTLFSPIAQKYVWRDKTVLVSFKTALLLANQTNNGKLVKATTNFLSSALVGAPDDFFEKIHELRIIVSLLSVLSNSSNYSEESLKSIICCFGLLCDGTQNCKKDLVDLDVGKFVLDIGEKYALDEDFNELAALTYDDIIFLKQDGRTIENNQV